MRLLITLCFALISAQADTLPELLTRMDQAAGQFKSMSAKTKRTEFTAVLNESSDSSGQVRLKKNKNSAFGIVEFSDPDPRVFHFSGRSVEIFYPKANTVEIYDAGKHANMMDQFVLMGFGTSGVDLRKNYQIKLVGTEIVSGTRVSHLELIPKSDEVKKLASNIELWIPEGQSSPIQEKVTQPSKNYSLVAFSDIKINPPLADSEFELKLPQGVKKLYPQK